MNEYVIAKYIRLFQAGYPTPREHIELLRGKEIKPECLWENRAVLRMLTNEQYIGTYISGKQVSKAVGSSSKILTDKSEWIVMPDKHTPIISKEIFERVQYLLETRLKSKRSIKPVGTSWKENNKHPKRERLLNGDKVVAIPIYGYSKSESGKLEVDPNASDVVRKMFELAKQGLSSSEISSKFLKAGYPTPREYLNLSRGRDIEPTCKWSVKFIAEMLKNIQYTGAYVSGKILKDYDTGKSSHMAKEDWVIIPDMHPPIISKELYEEVQGIITNKRLGRRNMTPRDYLLRGKVKCGICGYSLSYDPVSIPVLRCYHTSGNPSSNCYKMKVVVHELDKAILDIIKVHSQILLSTTEIPSLKKAGNDAQQIIELEQRGQELIDKRRELYEQYISAEIERDVYLASKADCNAQLEKVNAQLVMHRVAEQSQQSKQKIAKLAKTALSDTASPKDIVDMLIDKILVFPNDNLEIVWKVKEFWITEQEKMK